MGWEKLCNLVSSLTVTGTKDKGCKWSLHMFSCTTKTATQRGTLFFFFFFGSFNDCLCSISQLPLPESNDLCAFFMRGKAWAVIRRSLYKCWLNSLLGFRRSSSSLSCGQRAPDTALTQNKISSAGLGVAEVEIVPSLAFILQFISSSSLSPFQKH